MDWLTGLASTVWESFTRVIRYPLDETQRVYIPYLIASLVIATGVYAVVGRKSEDGQQRGRVSGRLLRFLFPPEIWRHRSTWVDVKFFIPHQMVRIWIYTSLVTLISTVIMNWTFTQLEGLKKTPGAVFEIESRFGLAVLYTVVTIVVADFFAFLMHYLQHKVPILWQFHKVHHSAEVLNPLTNYREHPIDNLAYAVVLSFATGVTAGVFGSLFWVGPPIVQILGINAFMFAYNVSGYHLRHSHVWLRWPGPLAYLFGCPAHHQIHHSCKPEHINKNMAFMFPIWDVLFRTFYLPKKREEMVFGIGDGSEGEYKGLLSIYLRPFVELFSERPKSMKRDRALSSTDSEASISTESRPPSNTQAVS